jgi:hypothetical protein
MRSVGSSVVVAVTVAGAAAFFPLTSLAADAGPTDAGALVDAAVPSSLAQAADAGVPESIHGCVPSLAKGAARPVVSEEFPRHGVSGWVATLTLTILHGKGEHVLPTGMAIQRGSDAEKELQKAGFAFPEQDGGTGATTVTVLPEDKDHPEIVTTVLEMPVLLLPEKPGRSALTLPPLPVAVARANGEVSTVCTRAHTITVDDPISEAPDPEPRPNPPPRPQREEWREAKIAAIVLALAAVLGAIFAWALHVWRKRPKPVPPPPPPRPAWEVALEKLGAVRRAGYLDEGRADEHCDRVSDALREYVGKTLGFDGLERTTDEIAIELGRSGLPDAEKSKVLEVLRECDLVKFAKFVPDGPTCLGFLDTAEAHVKRTMPRLGSRPEKGGPTAGAEGDAPARDTTEEGRPEAPRPSPTPDDETRAPSADEEPPR